MTHFFSITIIPVLLVIVAVILFLFICERPWKSISKNKMTTFVLLGVIIVIGLFFRLEQPLEHHIYFDEDLYLSASKLISLGNFHVDNPYVKKNAYELLLAGMFFIFGKFSETIAFAFNTILGVLTIPLVFFVTREIWSEEAGILAAFFLAILPEHIKWSVTTSLEVPAIFFALISLLFFIMFVKNKNPRILLLSIFTSIFLSFIRPEMIVIPALLISYTVWQHKIVLRQLLTNSQNAIFSILAIILLIFSGLISVLSRQTWSNIWFGAHNVTVFFSLSYFVKNVRDIFGYNLFLHNIFFFLLIATSIVGIIVSLHNKNSRKISILLCAVSFFLFGYYCAFFDGGYSFHNTVHSRFAAIWLSFLTLFSGAGYLYVLEKINRKCALFIGGISLLVLAVFLQINRTNFFPPAEQWWAVEEDQASLVFARANPSCSFISIFPYYLNFHNIPANPSSEKTSQCEVFFAMTPCQYEDKKICD